jgi:hypothetical protein
MNYIETRCSACLPWRLSRFGALAFDLIRQSINNLLSTSSPLLLEPFRSVCSHHVVIPNSRCKSDIFLDSFPSSAEVATMGLGILEDRKLEHVPGTYGLEVIFRRIVD